MAPIEPIRWVPGLMDESTTRLVEDLRDAPLTRPTPNGGNHALWVVGHLAVVEGRPRRRRG